MNKMRCMVFDQPGHPLRLDECEIPKPSDGEVLVRVRACAVCRTDLHLIDGELTNPKRPLIPGHEIVGQIESIGSGVSELHLGNRVGIPWLGWTCGCCPSCQQGRENLCDQARFTGYTLDGGYADYVVADARYCFPIPDTYTDVSAAPLLCAGLIGYRSLRMAGNGERLGLYGFGAAAHIVIQIARYQGREVYGFTRPGDTDAQAFARSLGASWAGDSDLEPPVALDAAIIFAPAGQLVPLALRAVRKGGTVVCGGIHMSDIPSFPYHLLWEERRIQSVANLTRRDGLELMELAPKVPIRTTIQEFPLSRANEALDSLRQGRLTGAAVLTMD
jgi:propanol-preferring alcohol dehydrogenase